MKRSDPPPKRPLRLFRKLGLAALGTLLALLALEGLSRLVFPDWAPTRADRNFWAHDEVLGWAHRPGETSRMVHVDFEIDVAINSMGLRDTEYGAEPAPGKRRVIVLGDSFGWGFGVEREQIFCELIEAERDDLEVVNASVSGYGTDQQSLWFEHAGRKLHPDVVLLLFYENDFENNARGFQYYHHKPRFDLNELGVLELLGTPVPEPTLAERAHAYLLGHTYLLARIYALMGPGRLPEDIADAQRAQAEDRLSRSGEVTRLLMARIAAHAAEAGAEFIVASVPMHAAYRAALSEMVEAAGGKYVPLDEAFEGVDEPTTFEHDGHWNARGHALAARHLADAI